MQAKTKNKQPNARLRFEREVRGWTQQYVAEHLGTDMNIVSRWECGERKPGPYYRQKLIELFGKSAFELGFVEAQASPALSSDAKPHLTSPQCSLGRGLLKHRGGLFQPRRRSVALSPPKSGER